QARQEAGSQTRQEARPQAGKEARPQAGAEGGRACRRCRKWRSRLHPQPPRRGPFADLRPRKRIRPAQGETLIATRNDSKSRNGFACCGVFVGGFPWSPSSELFSALSF